MYVYVLWAVYEKIDKIIFEINVAFIFTLRTNNRFQSFFFFWNAYEPFSFTAVSAVLSFT